ncbi:MAG: aminodeoxychorismate synthase component I [Planctomycetes bacterium]|nr:aminodeoxychorismate synthase component I [Planctomycetota bacterium]
MSTTITITSSRNSEDDQRVFEPLELELPPEITPEVVFSKLCNLPGCIWLDSALRNDPRSQFSFIAADPVDLFTIDKPTADPLAYVEQWLAANKTFVKPNVPFQGGWAGMLGYEFGRCFEKVPQAIHDELGVPLCWLGLYDVVFAWQHSANSQPDRGWIFSQGFLPTGEFSQVDIPRKHRATLRLAHFQKIIEQQVAARETTSPPASLQAMAHGLRAEQFETRLGGGWLGNFDSLGYRNAVEKTRQYILAGDVFQVNLSQRLLCPERCPANQLMTRLRQVNPAPFAGYLDIGSSQIISASPERFIQVRDRWIETRPIKGTRRRSGDSKIDAQLADELRNSTKDRSENIMIVDLLRNDLSRVCEPDSLQVDRLCEIETFPFLLHMVSSIRGRLKESVGISQLLAAVFPGGSITGAPKIRAMEIISELEPTVRGPYCGCLGYVATNGDMDWNIMIRTITASHGWWQFQVGGGIVLDSQPDQEEEETWTKAAGIVEAIKASLQVLSTDL